MATARINSLVNKGILIINIGNIEDIFEYLGLYMKIQPIPNLQYRELTSLRM